MLFYISLLLLALTSQEIFAAVAIGLAGISEADPAACVDETTGLAHNISSTWRINGTCGQHACVFRDNTLYITFETCGYVQASSPCYTVEDLTLDFPSCCPRIVCEQAERNEIDTDDYGHYTADREDELYMMSSYDSPQYLSYDVVLSDDNALESPQYTEDWGSQQGNKY